MKNIFAIILFALYTASACAQPGSLDTTFSFDGKLTTPIGGRFNEGYSVAIQADGKIVQAGFYSSDFNKYDFALTRYNTDGSLDTSFDGDGRVSTDFAGNQDRGFFVTIQSDGKILVAGGSIIGSGFDFAIARYNTDGSLDTSFDGDGKINTDFLGEIDIVNSIAVQMDGKIIVAGFRFDGMNSDFAIARYNTDGSLDNSFDFDGKVTTSIGTTGDYIRSIALQTDGKIIVAGHSYNATNRDFAVARYNVDGSLDNSFDSDGIVTTEFASIPGTGDESASSVNIQSDGKIILVGYTQNGSQNHFAVARYNADGSLDNSFDGDGKLTTDFGLGSATAMSSKLQNDGKLVVAGWSTADSTSSDADFAVVRYNIDGSLDTSFDGDGKLTTDIGSRFDYGNSVAIQTDGKIIVAGINNAGYTSYIDPDFTLVRYNTDGSIDSSFDIDGKVTTNFGSSNDIGNSVAIQADGKIVVVGYISDGISKELTVTRYNTNGSLDNSFGGDGIVTIDLGYDDERGNSVAIQADGKIVVAGNSFLYLALARFNADGSLDTSFDGDGIQTIDLGLSSDNAYAIAIQTDGKLVVAGNSGIVFAVTRFNIDGSLDNTFDGDGRLITNFVGSTSACYAVAIQADGKIVVAGNSDDDFALVRYNIDGSLDSSFDSDGKLTTNFGIGSAVGKSIAIQSDGKLVVAGLGDNGTSNIDFILVRYKTDGSLDNSFDSDGKVFTDFGSNMDDKGNSIIIQADGKMVVAGSSSNGSNSDFALARYNTDGSLDLTFDNDGRLLTDFGAADDIANAVAIQTDGKIVAAGQSADPVNDIAVARYNVACIPVTSSPSISICAGQSITLGSNTYTLSGTYTDVIMSSSGCDSTVTLNLTVNANSTFEDSLNVCITDLPTTWNGIMIPDTATSNPAYTTFTTSNSLGCDSVITLNLTVNNCIGIEEETQSQFNIFPNPFTDEVSIHFDNSIQHTINVYDVHGRKMIDLYSKENEVSIITKDWSAGIFIVAIDDKWKKIIKN